LPAFAPTIPCSAGQGFAAKRALNGPILAIAHAAAGRFL